MHLSASAWVWSKAAHAEKMSSANISHYRFWSGQSGYFWGWRLNRVRTFESAHRYESSWQIAQIKGGKRSVRSLQFCLFSGLWEAVCSGLHAGWFLSVKTTTGWLSEQHIKRKLVELNSNVKVKLFFQMAFHSAAFFSNKQPPVTITSPTTTYICRLYSFSLLSVFFSQYGLSDQTLFTYHNETKFSHNSFARTLVHVIGFIYIQLNAVILLFNVQFFKLQIH